MADQSMGSKESDKKAMTEEERAALCKKLDQELDDFINGLERKRYTEGWPEDRWEEEMDKHPFFMKQNPESGEVSPLVEGLAKLKYDPDENTALELATNYKEDGNFNYKHKNYRLALIGYTEGIKVKCGDPEMEAGLYNNRSAAHWQLKNYRSSLADCEKALTYNPGHTKARLRAAKSAALISKHDTCIHHCEKLLENNEKDEAVLELMNNAKREKLIRERNRRKQFRALEKYEEQKASVMKTIIDRGIRMLNYDADDKELTWLESRFPGAEGTIPHFDEGVLHWPVLFFYPEYKITDIIIDCPENVPLSLQVEKLFPAQWDENKQYSIETVKVYYLGYDRKLHIVDPKNNLADLLGEKYFELLSGNPIFVILPHTVPITDVIINNLL